VSLNGAPGAVNWVGGNGTVISVATPPLATLCGEAGAPASGDCGTGVLVRDEDGEWKIAQYALTFPMPNDLAEELTARIREFERVGKSPQSGAPDGESQGH
jgi:hypothetical protein